MQKVIAVNFKSGGKVYYFIQGDCEAKVHDRVLVDTAKNKQLGYVVKTDIEVDEKDFPDLKPIIRVATEKDIAKEKEMYKDYDEILHTIKEQVSSHKLDMKVCDIEFPFDGGKIIINFTSDDRVDFRDLVKDLANILHQRIELRQIGVRDQAKNIGAIGVCGQECCCTRYLSDFDKVSIKMAKNQNLSLNPGKISGMCGRLMCCLSYENDFYVEQLARMPRINAKVSTPSGVGHVMYNDLFHNIVTVKFEKDDTSRMEDFPLDKIKVLSGGRLGDKDNGKK